jgi:protein TonB
VAAHSILLWKSLEWEPVAPAIGSQAAAVTIALLSEAVAPALRSKPEKNAKQEQDARPKAENAPPPSAANEAQEEPPPVGEEAKPQKIEKRAATSPPKKRTVAVAAPTPLSRREQRPVASPKAQPRRQSQPPSEELSATEFVDDAPAATTSQPKLPDDHSSEPAVNLNPRFRRPPVPPAYPRHARRMGQEGTVLVQARLDSEGNVQQLRVVSTSGFELLDESALKAVRRWEFAPARRKGRPVESWVQVPVKFVLQ